MDRKALFCLLTLFLPLVSMEAIGNAIVLNEPPDGLKITTRAKLYEDSTGKLSIEDVSDPELQPRFSAIDDESFNVGVSDSVFWLKFQLLESGSLEPAGSILLEVMPAFIDDIRLIWRDDDTWMSLPGGDQIPLIDRQFKHPNYVFQLPDSSAGRDFYLRIESKGPISSVLRLWGNKEFIAYTSRAQLAQGIYYAIMLSMLGYNLFLFFALRDPAYFFYVTYLAGMVLFLATFYGDLQMSMWPKEWPLYNPLSVNFLLLSIYFGMHFARKISDLENLAPVMDRVIRWGSILVLITLMPVNVFYHFTIDWVPIVAIVSIGMIVHSLVITSLRGNRSSRLTLLAFLVMIPGGLAMALRNLGVVDASYFSEHALQWGTALEAFLLSLVLADRINILQREKNEAREALFQAERESLASQRQYSKKLLETQDAERKRLARELHDGFGQSLATLSNTLKRWMRKGTAPESGEYHDATSLTKGLMEDIRSISHNLHPHQLDKLGLKAALQSVADHTGNIQGLTVDADIEAVDDILGDDEKLHIYRLLQEAMTNVQRHARATRAGVQLVREGDNVVLRVTDNGIGLSEGEDSHSMGLTSMRERARAMGASLKITGHPDSGTTVELILTVGTSA